MAVKIKRERPDQRRHHRITAPLFVEVDGHRVRAADWSLGGLRVEGFPGRVPNIGSSMKLDLTLPFQGFDVSFSVEASVVRVNPAEAMFAVQFTEIGERERELMSHFIEELVRGSMSDVEDTIQRIDVPVTPASLKPDAKPTPVQMAKALPARRLPVRLMAMSTFYLLLGLAVFSYAAVLVYTNMFRMEVKTAVITAPVERVEAQVDGRVELVGIKPGDTVRRGETILNLFDSQLEREIAIADIEVKERKAKLAYLKRRHASELERIRGFATVEMKNVRQTKLDVESVEEQLNNARRQQRRLKHLFDRGFTTAAKYDSAANEVVKLEKRLEQLRIELASRAQLAEANIGKRLYTGDDLIGDGEELDAQVRLAQHEVELAHQRYKASLTMRANRSVRAPFDGTILELPRHDDASVRRGDVVAIVEQRRDRHVTAYLTQDEVNKVGMGDEALLYIPALGESLRGRVVNVDRTSGFIREQDQRTNPGYSWRGPTDRSAKVTIAFSEPEKARDYRTYRSGLPVVVVFERRATNSLFAAIGQKFGGLL